MAGNGGGLLQADGINWGDPADPLGPVWPISMDLFV